MIWPNKLTRSETNKMAPLLSSMMEPGHTDAQNITVSLINCAHAVYDMTLPATRLSGNFTSKEGIRLAVDNVIESSSRDKVKRTLLPTPATIRPVSTSMHTKLQSSKLSSRFNKSGSLNITFKGKSPIEMSKWCQTMTGSVVSEINSFDKFLCYVSEGLKVRGIQQMPAEKDERDTVADGEDSKRLSIDFTPMFAPYTSKSNSGHPLESWRGC